MWFAVFWQFRLLWRLFYEHRDTGMKQLGTPALTFLDIIVTKNLIFEATFSLAQAAPDLHGRDQEQS